MNQSAYELLGGRRNDEGNNILKSPHLISVKDGIATFESEPYDAAFASELGLDYGTYYTLERGITSAQANSAKSLLHNKVLSQLERQLLKCASKQKKKISEITITDADRLAYQRRKNEMYKREMAK